MTSTSSNAVAGRTLREANLARQAEWDKDDKITGSYRGNELAGEVGEACNVIKKLERERLGIRGSRATIKQLAEELADVVICADLIAMHYNIDLLDSAVPDKFNATSEKVGLGTRYVPANNHDRLTAEVERLSKLLRDMIECVDGGAIEMNSQEIDCGYGTRPYPWHEEWLHHARATISHGDSK